MLFIGDGMSLSTVTAARIFKGQQAGRSGEEEKLIFETFPHVAMAKVGDYFNTNVIQVHVFIVNLSTDVHGRPPGTGLSSHRNCDSVWRQNQVRNGRTRS